MQEPTLIPDGFADIVPAMQSAHTRVLDLLRTRKIGMTEFPEKLPPADEHGRAAARAYPMQGVLKYHGMSDWQWRIAYLPSISLNNDAAVTITTVAFDPQRTTDEVYIGGKPALGREHERVVQILAAVRTIAGAQARARVESRNIVRASITGKGLGTSASGAAALACAAIGALLGPDLARNSRFVSSTARLLAGSGCRSAAGGAALWLSYPGIPHTESFAVRLDPAGQLDDVRLITVPLDSRVGLKTEAAHHDAPASSFFKSWMLSRGAEIEECITAIHNRDWRVVGQFAELDSMRLHGVTMSGSREQKLIGWEPENIAIFRMCNTLRAQGVPVYASTDTGPTVVLITHRDHADAVAAAVAELGLEYVRGAIGGPAELIDFAEARSLIMDPG
jgi:diphosphomevalonate decarboxylase